MESLHCLLNTASGRYLAERMRFRSLRNAALILSIHFWGGSGDYESGKRASNFGKLSLPAQVCLCLKLLVTLETFNNKLFAFGFPLAPY